MSNKEITCSKPFKIIALTLLIVLIINLSYKLFLRRYLKSTVIWCLGIANTDRNDIMWWQVSPLLERWVWQLVDNYESGYE
ncbi:ANL_collapsed_G0018240.mRNA.1.CDS.1 [Saccharomyces cerevisiae]|nr:AVN_HP_G0129920.mRNA.1.CDS.1 [Saccharomyces cerevisiae]CAI4960662.1 AVN_HP_G0013300.mRNA.1.CDS.1 [Saccharomyces cerevisiae]CAI5030885.1 AVN_HP_G0071010.mRNA.1.CDS.1 [Saccharomyces cerevisiae]CAI6398640.1 AVN_HP_G0129920.mRNA.1.CDS.1 [Saccharomyces cerevisiae]CAI6654284.1 ANL_collapsed_G0018240.mRNA.1.CDS.1 [Saccharomyces cerevisiae]